MILARFSGKFTSTQPFTVSGAYIEVASAVNDRKAAIDGPCAGVLRLHHDLIHT
jgi:hypothetical protein